MSIKSKIQELKGNQQLKDKIYQIIFGTDTPAGKRFDVILLVLISVSVLLIVFDSIVQNYVNGHDWIHYGFIGLEMLLQVFFICEYILRIYSHPNPKEYALSFFGIIDLLSIIPFGYNVGLRTLRIIRVFRVFRMLNFLEEGHELLISLQKSMNKILVFFFFVFILNICMGCILWVVESGSDSTINTALDGIYCSIVTMTTVGYGDTTPTTGLGKTLLSMMMLIGYTIVAIPTGIVSAEMVKERAKRKKYVCPSCGKTKHLEHAKFCDACGTKLLLKENS